MYMHIVYIQYTLCEVLNEVPTVKPGTVNQLPAFRTGTSTSSISGNPM